MLCEKCDETEVIPEHEPSGSECGHDSMRSRATLCERCSTKQCRCQGCGKNLRLSVVKGDSETEDGT